MLPSVLAFALGMLIAGPVTPAAAEEFPCDGQNPDPAAAGASNHYPAYDRTVADTGGPITPDEAIARGMDWIEEPGPSSKGSLNYCQTDYYPDRHGELYRTDCSGFVSMMWQIDKKGTNNGFLAGTGPNSVMDFGHTISWNELQPGDAVNNEGHIEMVSKVSPMGVETLGFGHTPPETETYGWISIASSYVPVRYDNMQVITDEMVREELEARAPRPEPSIEPPNGQTFVQWPTIFYTSGEPYNEVVPMTDAGIEVELYAERVGFLWHFDDDSPTDPFSSGANPGVSYTSEDYPAGAITHIYEHTDRYEPSVDITWSNYRYRIVDPEWPDHSWHEVDGDHVGEGPSTPINVLELDSRLMRDEDPYQ